MSEREARSDDTQFLLADFEHWSQSYWNNEQLGETRVSLFVGLAGVTMGWSAVLTANQRPAVLLVMLGLGVLTLLRIIRRNRVTTSYLRIIGMLREHLMDEQLLSRVKEQLPPPEARRKLHFGGLTTVVAGVNALLATALVFTWVPAISAANAAFAATSFLQWVVIRRLELGPEPPEPR